MNRIVIGLAIVFALLIGGAVGYGIADSLHKAEYAKLLAEFDKLLGVAQRSNDLNTRAAELLTRMMQELEECKPTGELTL